MITEEDILKIQSELTKTEFQKLIYYLKKDNLYELKELARNKTIKKFVNPMRKKINSYINSLYINNNIRRETINLLNQTYTSLNNVQRLIKNKSIVDSNTILRSAFENIVMAMMIDYDENVYNEFINLSTDDTTRNFTKPQTLRNNFRKVLRNLDYKLFDDLNNKMLKSLLDELYDKLCLFTHSTLIVNTMVELKKDNKEDLYIFAIKQTAYFIEILLYLCLKFLSDDKNDTIDFKFAVIGYLIIFSDINKESVSIENIQQLKKYLYYDINEDLFKKENSNIEMISKDLLAFQKDIEANPIIIIEIIKELLK